MGSHCYARLMVRESGIGPDLRARIEGQGDWEVWADGRGERLIVVEDGEAWNGEFAELEAELVRRGVAFDRYTDGYGSFQPRERRFRPARDGRPGVDVEVVLTADGEPFVPLGELRELLRLQDPDALRARLAELIERAEPVPPLDEEQGV